MKNSESDVTVATFLDLERELAITRNVLAALPVEHFDWKPHEKSMTLGRLASHVADMPAWMRMTFDRDKLDAATAPRPPEKLSSRDELLDRFDRNVSELRDVVAKFDIGLLRRDWSMCQGDAVIVTKPRDFVYRVWCLNHLIHHRGQLCLCLRLLNVAVPTVYFNTADDPNFVFA